jgi:hypothetical protein
MAFAEEHKLTWKRYCFYKITQTLRSNIEVIRRLVQRHHYDDDTEIQNLKENYNVNIK